MNAEMGGAEYEHKLRELFGDLDVSLVSELQRQAIDLATFSTPTPQETISLLRQSFEVDIKALQIMLQVLQEWLSTTEGVEP